MVTVNYINQLNGAMDLSCLSTDELPIDTIKIQEVNYEVRNGSIAFLIDKSCYKMFDEENKKWYELEFATVDV